MRDTTIDIEVMAGTDLPLRTFVIHFSSTLKGYEARVSEREYSGQIVPVGFHLPLQQEIHARTFYADRARYGQQFLRQVVADLNAGSAGPSAGREGAALPSSLGANVVGFTMAEAVADDLTRWDPLDVADKASAVPGTARLLSQPAGGAQS